MKMFDINSAELSKHLKVNRSTILRLLSGQTGKPTFHETDDLHVWLYESVFAPGNNPQKETNEKSLFSLLKDTIESCRLQEIMTDLWKDDDNYEKGYYYTFTMTMLRRTRSNRTLESISTDTDGNSLSINGSEHAPLLGTPTEESASISTMPIADVIDGACNVLDELKNIDSQSLRRLKESIMAVDPSIEKCSEISKRDVTHEQINRDEVFSSLMREIYEKRLDNNTAYIILKLLRQRIEYITNALPSHNPVGSLVEQFEEIFIILNKINDKASEKKLYNEMTEFCENIKTYIRFSIECYPPDMRRIDETRKMIYQFLNLLFDSQKKDVYYLR